ncbi:uncharacterized protein EDB91DRAFT_1248547 [Suillus paluster]|uniref:uncharacterized protein n=1 Tax=Suillus paluster TaxID=48578 RepID=UPI001B85D1DF|nr:uncharacterized protein EDB91DRAFT_1248547 [Suillus paluster]KAG1740220.1 hypothetical protein EDB91DRAFT_1248547 [Suillus paluster]
MPPKSSQSKKLRHKKTQNTRQIQKPARRSNENPCLNADNSQVGRTIEQTEDPGLEYDKTVLVMHEEEMLDFELNDFSDMGSGHQQPQIQPPYNDNHDNQYPSGYHAPFPQQPQYTQDPQPPYVPQMQHVTLQPPHTLPNYDPHQQHVPLQPPHTLPNYDPHQQHAPLQLPHTLPNYNQHQQHGPQMNQASSLQHTMTVADLFLTCSISEPPPPTVRGAERLSRHLQDPQARPIRPSPYALPGLRKVTVLGPCCQHEHYRGKWQNTGVARSSTDVAQKRPMAKDLPPHPHPLPTQSHNNGSSDPHPGPPQQEAPDNPQANPPIPIPAEQVEEHKYELKFHIWDTSSEVTHKLWIMPVLTTHLQCLFTSENMMLDGVLQSVPVLEHDGLVSLVIKILWTHGFYKDIDFDDLNALDGVIALAAQHSAWHFWSTRLVYTNFIRSPALMGLAPSPLVLSLVLVFPVSHPVSRPISHLISHVPMPYFLPVSHAPSLAPSLSPCATCHLSHPV